MQVTHAWYYSRRLQRDMQLITYGSKGYPFLVFPTQDGKAGQWEDFGMIEVLRPFIENGAVRLYCIDSVDQESWSDTNGDKSRRAQVQEAYFQSVCEDVVPRIDGKRRPVATGCSMGANHSVNTFLRRPDLFGGCLALSGVYDTNVFFGEISYITKALSAVLQLAVTMDYSIFLWHSYNEQREKYPDNKEAMMVAIRETLSSVIGSSITTVAGFIALCFMSFTMGRDLGLVMAKGVIIGVIGCVTVLPALILVLDKPLQKSRHRSLIPGGGAFSKGIIKIFPVFLILFAILLVPSFYGYKKASNEVYYDISASIPQDMPNVVANKKLQSDFEMATQHMVLTDSTLDPGVTRKMISEMELR